MTVTFKPSEIICAHVGDSRASAKIGKSDVELTSDHDPGVSAPGVSVAIVAAVLSGSRGRG